MARKRLIKGANAERVEARISRVPADLGAQAGEDASIFGALRALEGAAAAVPKRAAASQAASVPKRAAASQAASVPKRAAPPAAKTAAKGPAVASSGQSAKIASQPKRERLRPIEFSAAERRAILRCCTDYRNRLPTYLLSAQKEIKVIDSIIEKCGPVSPD
jgi:hypothetical protein